MPISNVSSGVRFGVCTSTTRPSAPYVGQIIFESDTAQLRYWDGTIWNNAMGSPVGSVQSFAGSSAPTGWLLCAGQTVSRTTYSSLFTVIGTTYGIGDGSTTFTLPDLRGRTIAGIDNMGGSDAGRLSVANTLGTATGAETVTLSSANLPLHQHTIDHDHGSFNATSGGMSANASHTHAQVYNGSPSGGGLDGSKFAYGTVSDLAWRSVSISSTNTDHTHTTTIDVPNFAGSSGDGGFANTAVDKMQPTLILNYIIKV